ncbi:hypothetical protein RB653_006018 [Dictyostelium firmibasis]|uniref:Pseudouridine synthase I TruA alpha/beta domain-containing protein n=1 Tax=Dictyostelium firmibasis TaxID=79012 RepID=A0AAN7Z1P5_9MYCE
MNNNEDIFLKRGSYKQEIIKNENDKKYFNKVISNNNQVEKDKEILEKFKNDNKIKTNEMRKRHMNDLNEYYLKYKEEIDLKLKINTKKLSVSMIFGYDGTGYYGLGYQVDIQYPSIENLIEKVLFRCGHILPSNVGELKRLKWSHSSRTDKGVHSLATVISCFLVVDDETSKTDINQSFIDNINSFLPQSIRLFNAIKVARSFQARKKGIERSYNYMVPTEYLNNITIYQMNKILENFIGINSFHNFTSKRKTYLNSLTNKNKENESENEIENPINQKEDENENNNEIEEIENEEENENNNENEEIENENFNNNDRLNEKLLFRNNSTNVRNIKSFYVENDTIEIQGKGWYKFVIIGESFILYQIRRMMGFFLSIVKGYSTIEALELSLKSPFSICVPTAPPFPLYLFNVEFDPLSKVEKLNSNIQQLQSSFLQSQLIPRFNQIENETNQFKDFFNYLENGHNFNLDDIDQLIILNQQYQIEKEERKIKSQHFLKEKEDFNQILKQNILNEKELRKLKKKNNNKEVNN